MTRKPLNLEKAQKVLDYWYAIEFLAQDKFDDMWEVRKKMQKAQTDFANGRFRGKSIWSYREINNSSGIYDIVSADAVSCGMKKWGNITVYIGRIKREACIECIAKFLPKSGEEERPEKAGDSIAWASLQIAPDGTYVEHSLSLSTILWSMNQIKNSRGRLSESMDEKQYRTEAEALEKQFFGKKEELEKGTGEEENSAGEADGKRERLQEFARDAVTVKTLKDLFRRLKEDFVDGNIELTEKGQEYQEVYGLYFQLFADEKSRSKLDEENYLGLSHDYFSEDIKYILEKIKDGSIASQGHMSDDLIRYICALCDDGMNEKIDLVSPESREDFFRQVSEILEPGNAPLGKWPSRFMPAFMQQIAVNLCIRKGKSDLFGLNGKVFSVNGPPGTGKTTLLKEIVVSNIIERAILLAKYKDPDDAFEKHSFLHGDKQGGSYSAFTRGWYSLKNDRINDYGILVTSCNNAAVENVSKELPMGAGILNDLKPSSEDTEEYAGMLKEVGGLFDPAQSQTCERISKNSCKDVYFTEYARGLFGNEGVWGLVAAPLGKKINISAFYNHVLYPLYWDFYMGKNFKAARMEKYAQAREEFQKQLEAVMGLQKQLKDINALIRKRAELVMNEKALEKQLHEKRAECQLLTEREERQIAELNVVFAQRQSEVRSALQVRNHLEERIAQTEQEAGKLSLLKKELLEKEVAVRGAVGIFGRIFNKKKAAANEQLAAQYHEDFIKADAERERLKGQADELYGLFQDAQSAYDRAVSLQNQTEKQIAGKKYTMTMLEGQLRALEGRLARERAALEDMESMYQEKVRAFSREKSPDAGLILDEGLTERLLSKDIKESTAAQTGNPWFTKRYNAEREKLFYFAMKLNKEFVLSSKSARDNFKTLGHYWGMLQGDDKERIVFHREDKERFAGALYQTLFLLVPVLSTTFASLGTFLRDAKQTGVIGTLIVDEAGQAQPQMAVGALYRSRRAMIVGDPKQVEPVVTDDLNLLKRAYDDEELKRYKSRTISVQSFADSLNSFGTFLDNGTDYPEWVGCPLLVHRRCISPMYDISNAISYNGIMKQQTREPDAKKAEGFVYEKSQWIQVAGKEKGNKNHFVEEQAAKVCEILEAAFSKSDNPGLYIISPFTSVVNGMKAYIKNYVRKTPGTKLGKCDPEWMSRNIGTVHTFQGKEADEVIFLLGCDKSKEAGGAVRWVNTNIVNVAVTRAKYRLYVIGDETAWQSSDCVRTAKTILDTFAIQKIQAILEENLPEQEKASALAAASAALPSVTAFARDAVADENGEIEFCVNTDSLVRELEQSFITTELSREQLGKFGFLSKDDFRGLPRRIQDNLLLGMKLFYLLKPVYDVNRNLDASCCAILFCKALELRMKECFEESLKAVFPDEKIRGGAALKDAGERAFTLGTFHVLLKAKSGQLGKRMELKGKMQYDEQWWRAFAAKLSSCAERRNKCCHSGLFRWGDQSFLLADMFRDTPNAPVQMEGIFFAGAIGKSL